MILRLRLFAEAIRTRAFAAVFVSVLIIQIFLPPVVGMADNGDFIRLTPGARIIAAYPETERYFGWFTPEFVASPNPRQSASWIYSGQLAVIAAKAIQWCKPAVPLDILWVAFVHLWLLLFCFLWLLKLLEPAPALPRWIGPALAIWIFADFTYAACLNSLYADAMGFLSLFALLLSFFVILKRGAPLWATAMFAAAGIMFAASKPTNSPNAIWIGLALTAFGMFRMAGARRANPIGAGLLVAAFGVTGVVLTPASYSVPALVNVVTVRLLKEAPDTPHVLTDFGLDPSDLRYAGMNWFMENGPGFDPAFVARFRHNTSAALIRWYLRHPAVTTRFLWEDLLGAAPELPHLGFLEKHFAPQPFTRSRAFSSSTDLRSWIIRRFPAAIPLLYLLSLLLAISVTITRKSTESFAFAVLLALIAVLGIINFAVASLMDAIEKARHLFMFQVSTDLLVFLLFIGLLTEVSRYASRARNRSITLQA